MATATVNAKGQITIPVQVRAALGLQPGDEIEFIDLRNGQFAIVAATCSVKRLKGLIRKPKVIADSMIIRTPIPPTSGH